MDRKYVVRTLTDHEELILTFGYHWTRYMNTHFIKLALIPQGIGLVLGVVTYFLPIALTWWVVIPPLLLWITTICLWWKAITCDVHIVTNRRIIYKKGFLTRDTNEIKLSAIEAITIKQGIWGRVFRVGTLTILGRGHGNKLIFEYVSRPILTKHTIENSPWRENPGGVNTEEIG